MVYCSDVASYDTGIDTLLTNVNGKQALQASMIVTQEAMNSQQTNHTEIPQNLQDITATTIIIPISSSELFNTFLLLLQYLNDTRLLHQCLQEVQHSIHIPSLYVHNPLILIQ